MNERDYTIDLNGVLRINEGVTEIEDEFFSRDLSIKKVILPDSLREIGDIAFAGCLNLREVEFNEDLIYIGRKAFYETAIERIEFKAGPSIVKSLAFGLCKQLREVYFGRRISMLGTFVFHQSALERAVFPEGTCAAPVYSFRDCENLEYLECDNLETGGMEKIKSAERNVIYAFLASSLQKEKSIREKITEYIKTHSEWFAVRAAERRDINVFSYLIENGFVSDLTFKKLLGMDIAAEIKTIVLEYMYEKYLLSDEETEL